MALEMPDIICFMSLFPTFSPAEFWEVIISSYMNKEAQNSLGLGTLLSGCLNRNINANYLSLMIKA